MSERDTREQVKEQAKIDASQAQRNLIELDGGQYTGSDDASTEESPEDTDQLGR